MLSGNAVGKLTACEENRIGETAGEFWIGERGRSRTCDPWLKRGMFWTLDSELCDRLVCTPEWQEERLEFRNLILRVCTPNIGTVECQAGSRTRYCRQIKGAY